MQSREFLRRLLRVGRDGLTFVKLVCLIASILPITRPAEASTNLLSSAISPGRLAILPLAAPRGDLATSLRPRKGQLVR